MQQLLTLTYQPDLSIRTHAEEPDIVVLEQDGEDIIYIHKNQIQQVIDALQKFLAT